MKRIIDGKSYNTDTADCICTIPCSYYPGDFQYHNTKLYRSPKGQYFIAGMGGPMTIWAESVGNSGTSGGSGMRLIDEEEAREWAESACLDEEEMTAAGFNVEEG